MNSRTDRYYLFISSAAEALRKWTVTKFYATHNNSKAVTEAVERVLRTLSPGKRGLNIGCGGRSLHRLVLNIDITKTPVTDCVADAQNLPFQTGAFNLILTQEVMEHVADPFQAMNEISRILCPGGLLYCQAPFIIGYHPGPTDFWRFTREGITKLIQSAGLQPMEVGIAVGPATGLYRVLVEFSAVLAARLTQRLYIPVKALAAILLFPLKWLDVFLNVSCQADRISGGYFVIARKG